MMRLCVCINIHYRRSSETNVCEIIASCYIRILFIFAAGVVQCHYILIYHYNTLDTRCLAVAAARAFPDDRDVYTNTQCDNLCHKYCARIYI